MNQSEKCNIYTNRLSNYKEYTKCTICKQKSHPKCNFLSKTDAELLLQVQDNDKTWTCYNCMKNIFPLIDENIVNINTDNGTTTECHCCRKLLGKKFIDCTICNKTISINDVVLINLDVRNVWMTCSQRHATFFLVE